MPAVILTGPPRSGKTTECLRVVAEAQRRGMTVGGVISRPRFVEGREVARDLVEVGAGDSRELCRYVGTGGHPLASAWVFNEEVLASGAAALAASWEADLVVVDEIGPIELLGNGGWGAVVDFVRERRHQLWLCVVRPSLLQRFVGLLADVDATVLGPDSWGRDQFLDQVKQR